MSAAGKYLKQQIINRILSELPIESIAHDVAGIENIEVTDLTSPSGTSGVLQVRIKTKDTGTFYFNIRVSEMV